MTPDALNRSVSTFQDWEATVPFSGRLNVSFAAAPDAPA
jgi:hypothetical protein